KAEIDPHERLARIRLVLARRARLVGRLVEMDGSAGARVPVTWQSYEPIGAERASASADGAFELGGLEPGRGEVALDLAGCEPRLLALAPGETRDLGNVAVPRLAMLTGRLTSRHLTAENRAGALGNVEVYAFRGGRLLSQLKQEDGAFSEALTPGPL